MMDIYRAEDRISKFLLDFTNGSPSFTVVLGVAAASIFFILLMALLNHFQDFNVFALMDKYAASDPTQVKGSTEAAAIAAFAGGVVSVLTRLDDFEKRRGIDPKLLFLNSISRPYIGAVMAMFVVAVQEIGLFTIVNTTTPDKASYVFFLIVVGFLSGFSERFARDFIGSVEGGVASRRPDSRLDGAT